MQSDAIGEKSRGASEKQRRKQQDRELKQMQRLTDVTTENRLSRTGLMNTPNTSEETHRRNTLAKIIVDDRVSRQQDPGPASETDVKAQAMLPLVRSIPTEHLYECFVL